MKFDPLKNARSSYPPLHYYKLDENAIDPSWGTEDAACFDLAACLVPGIGVKVYRPDNTTRLELVVAERSITVHPQERAMVPSGLIFDIPVGYDLKIYARSGTALKQGLSLMNKVGVVDYGYIDQSFLIAQNESTIPLTIRHGDRIAQGQMKKDYSYELLRTKTQPIAKTDRRGGFGSTGVGRVPEFSSSK